MSIFPTHLQLLSTIICVSLHVRRRSERRSGRRLRDSRPGLTSFPPKLSRSRPGHPSPRPSATICIRLHVSSSRCLRCASVCAPGGTQLFRPATVTRMRSRSSRRFNRCHELRLRRCWSEKDGTLSRMSVSMASAVDPGGSCAKNPDGTSQKCSSSTSNEGGSRRQLLKPRRSACSRQSLRRRGHFERSACSQDSVRKAPPRADSSRPRRRRCRSPCPRY